MCVRARLGARRAARRLAERTPAGERSRQTCWHLATRVAVRRSPVAHPAAQRTRIARCARVRLSRTAMASGLAVQLIASRSTPSRNGALLRVAPLQRHDGSSDGELAMDLPLLMF
jgi:hypothetical protein